MRYSFRGTDKKLTLGPHPLFGLAEARELAGQALRKIAGGEDPIESKRRAQHASETAAAEDRANDDRLLRKAWEQYRQRVVDRKFKRSTGSRVVRFFERDVLPRWAERRVDQITPADAAALLDAVEDRGPHAMNSGLGVLKAFFTWGRTRGMLTDSPCELLEKNPAASRERVLTDHEIQLFWDASDQIAYPFGALVQIALLTGARRGEVQAMTTRELRLREHLWVVPGAN